MSNFSFCPLLCSVGKSPNGRGYVATQPSCGPPSDLVPRSKALGTPPPDNRAYVAAGPPCGPLLIMSPTLKHLGPPK